MIIPAALARHICVLLGYLYPALASAKTAVQQDPAAFTQWMTYWVVISVFAVVELLVDFFISWLPFYYEVKIAFIVWLTLPKYQGASQIYQRLLHPYLVHYEGDIDNGLEGMRVEATRRLKTLSTSAANEIAKAVTRQGTSAKDQLLTRVLGVAAAAAIQDGTSDHRPVGTHSMSSSSSHQRLSRDELLNPYREDDAKGVFLEHAHAEALPDFINLMQGGIFAIVGAPFWKQEGEDSSRPQRIRMLSGTQFCLAQVDEEDGIARDDGENMEINPRYFEVNAVAADPHNKERLLLTTDVGQVTLLLPSQADRDSVMEGFELLLASNVRVTDSAMDHDFSSDYDEAGSGYYRHRVGSHGSTDRSSSSGASLGVIRDDMRELPRSMSPLRYRGPSVQRRDSE